MPIPNEYDAAIDSMLKDLREQLTKERPADLNNFLIGRLSHRPYCIPDPKSCERIAPHHPDHLAADPLTIVVFGASGDLAKKKTFPALFVLYCEGLLPIRRRNDGSSSSDSVLTIIGFARSKFTQKDFHEHLKPYLEQSPQHWRCHIDSFLAHHVRYVQGDSYTDEQAYRRLRGAIETHEQWKKLPKDEDGFAEVQKASSATEQCGNRLFYLALPPDAFVDTTRAVKQNLVECYNKDVTAGKDSKLFTRLIIEKPFGRDTESSLKLANAINSLFKESQIFRIDHYLGKEMVQNVVSLRFANHVFSSLWNNQHVHSVQITFKEKIGTEGRGGYFDKFGIIRDVIQNHLTQILALVAMDKPKTLSAEHVRDEKVALLRCVEVVGEEDCVLGQYTASKDGKIKGYLEDPGVPKDSKCPTFALIRLRINNDRWQGVPFILKAGKALEDKSVTVRIQFRDEIRPYCTAYPGSSSHGKYSGVPMEELPPNRNELVIRAQPNEGIYLKINTKSPGFAQENTGSPNNSISEHHSGSLASSFNPSRPAGSNGLTLTELDLSYWRRFNIILPDAYESLINEAVLGNSTNFVRSDELDAAWRIFTPLLHKIDEGAVKVLPYMAGTRGPSEADDMIESTGYRRSRDYFYLGNKL